MTKGRRRERECARIYEDAGYQTYRPPRARGGPTDVFGLFDLLAFDPGNGLRLVQVKSNGARGIEAFCEATYPFKRTPGLAPEMAVCYDREGWRLVVPSDRDSHVTIADEREQDCRMGELVTAILKPAGELP